MEIDRNGLEVLSRDECLRLLGTAKVGRIGTTANALPTVVPVNFRLDGDRVLVRTGAGAKLEAAHAGHVVAFEVDNFDSFGHSGWSVVVTGVATEVTSDPDVVDVAVPRWAPRGDGRIIAIATDVVSGRRLSVPAAAQARRPLRLASN